jgi:hypothetical protein
LDKIEPLCTIHGAVENENIPLDIGALEPCVSISRNGDIGGLLNRKKPVFLRTIQNAISFCHRKSMESSVIAVI